MTSADLQISCCRVEDIDAVLLSHYENLLDASERLKPEMFVRATPLGGNVLRPRVPNTALLSEGLKTFILVEQTPGEIRKREVVLAYRGHDDSYIETGLNTGERVVVGGALLLNAEMQSD